MARQAVVILFTLLAFGILVPWYKGFTFLDPRILLAYALLAVLFVAPASAESAAAEAVSKESEKRHPAARVLIRIARVVGFGWGITVLILGTALATLNLTNWHGAFGGPPARFLAAILTFSLAASFAVAALSSVLARRLTAGAVKSILRLAFLIVLLGLALSSRFAPERWQILLNDYSTRRALTRLAWEGSAVCAVLAVGLLIPLLIKRNRGA